MFRRIISIAAAVLIVFCLVPFSAFADAQIAVVEIHGVSLPVVGEKPDCSLFVPEGAGYRIDSFGWYKDLGDGEVPVDPETPFEAGSRYFLYLVVSPLAGYAFADGAAAEFFDDYGNAVPNSVEGFYFSGGMHYIFSEFFTPSQPVQIPSVAVNGFVRPVDGQSVQDLPLLTLFTSGCAIASVKWYKDNREFTGVFAAGNTYTMRIELASEYGYRFADNVSVSMSGEQVQTLNNDGKLLRISLDVPITIIRSIRLVSAYVPMAGAHQALHNGLSVPGGSPYSIASQAWLDENGASFDVFELGMQYYKSADRIAPAAGCAFASQLTVTLDGDPVEFTANSDGTVSVLCPPVVCSQQLLLLFGDVDENGLIDTTDALLVLRHALGLNSLPECVLPIADVSCNGVIDTEDALRVLRMALDLEGTVPYETPEPTEEPFEGARIVMESKSGVLPGSNITLSLSIEGSYSAHAFTAMLDYDVSKLTVLSVTNGSVLDAHDNAMVMLDHETEPGCILVGVLMPSEAMSETGALVNVTFRVANGFSGSTSIGVTVNEFVYCPDTQPVPVQYTTVDGIVSR